MGADADLVQRLAAEVFGMGNLDALDELLSADFVNHDPPTGIAGTREGMRETAAMVTAAYADRELEFHEELETADGRVVTNWAMSGIHTGEMYGLPPSGQRVRVRGVEIWRCSNGKITENWNAIDIRDVLEKARASSP